ncbi:hypothetical protein [Neorhizobium sp. DT-125]|uniref:hypothetical protein n=1 Tax=Neorhizobium sp. DT-125 TaxID=3396163 RepID=UPI003F19D435
MAEELPVLDQRSDQGPAAESSPDQTEALDWMLLPMVKIPPGASNYEGNLGL